AAVAGLQQDVHELLLCNRVADLHGPAAQSLRLGRKLHRGKRGAVNAVAASPAADGHDQVAGLRLFVTVLDGDQPNRAAEYQWVAEIAFIKANCSVDCRDAHAVAVIADAGYD